MAEFQRNIAVGAEPRADGSTHFRVWAPGRKRVSVVFEDGGECFPLSAEQTGYFSGNVKNAHPGRLYRYRLDDGAIAYPDPASRFQPDGPHGASQIVDPKAFPWTDEPWRGLTLHGQVLYEMHIGTFTPEGTWQAARKHLPRLRDVGITAIEVMPVADFAGEFGWGYDGVNLFAPTRLYGKPDDFRAFVDECHRFGLGVVLDVVYNHLGPDGNYLPEFFPGYFSTRYANEWGEALNFDGAGSAPVRELFISNARYWIEEFHLDGLRLDATQQIFDASSPHVLTEIVKAARAGAGSRKIIVIGENEPQSSRLVRPETEGGYGLDALWNDDFHHTAHVAATGRSEAYYSGYYGSAQEFISAAKWGFLYQGQHYAWQKKGRGSPAFDIPPEAFITFIENHDQVSNRADSERLRMLASPGVYRALTALLLLSPQTPMLFQGQEYGSDRPFRYFADHKTGLAELVEAGRRRFLTQFRSLAGDAFRMPPPHDRKSFEDSKLDHGRQDARVLALYTDLLKLRREDPVFSSQRADRMFGAVLGSQTLALRFFGAGADRLLLVNLGRDLIVDSIPEPLLAAPELHGWKILWSSESPLYGGSSASPIEAGGGWNIPGHSAAVLIPIGSEVEP